MTNNYTHYDDEYPLPAPSYVEELRRSFLDMALRVTGEKYTFPEHKPMTNDKEYTLGENAKDTG